MQRSAFCALTYAPTMAPSPAESICGTPPKSTMSTGEFLRSAHRSILGKVHAPEQILETGVGAQAIEVWISLQKYHPGSPFLIRSLQPAKGSVVFPQGGVDSGHNIGRDISLLGEIVQLM